MRSTMLAAGVMILGLACCGSIEVASTWRAAEIVIDGNLGDWQGQLWDIEKTPISVGVVNDGDQLYVGLRAFDARAAAQAFRQGLIVWIDPKGGRDKVLGIRYPIGRSWDDFEPPLGETVDGLPEPRKKNPDIGLDEVEILGPGRDERARFPLAELKGIAVAVSRRNGGIIYEMRIPFATSDSAPYAAGSGPGKTVGIGFDSARPDILPGGRGMGGGMPGGFGPGRGGGFRGRGGMIGIGRGGRANEPLSLWLKVRLAEPPKAQY